MKNKFRWFIPVLFVIASCTTTYTHPAKDNAQFEKDRVVCERVARKKLAEKGNT